METIFLVIKDAAICIMLAATLDRIQKGGDEKWHRIVFLSLLLVF